MLAISNSYLRFMRYIIQRYGDRGAKAMASIRSYAHTLPANPMSDRGQMVIEIYEGLSNRELYKSKKAQPTTR